MRTAEVILKEMWGENVSYNDWFKPIVEIINTARKEAIEECQIIVTEQFILGFPELIKPILDKLINQLK